MVFGLFAGMVAVILVLTKREIGRGFVDDEGIGDAFMRIEIEAKDRMEAVGSKFEEEAVTCQRNAVFVRRQLRELDDVESVVDLDNRTASEIVFNAASQFVIARPPRRHRGDA